MLETMGSNNSYLPGQKVSLIEDDTAVIKVQRLFAGEDNDSIGSLFSNKTTGIGYKGPTLTTNHENNTQTGNVSVGIESTPTTLTAEDIHSMSTTMLSIQGMMTEFIAFKTKMEEIMNSNNKQGGPSSKVVQHMEVDSQEPFKQSEKRKAADSTENSRKGS
jgi:hypothetical protein